MDVVKEDMAEVEVQKMGATGDGKSAVATPDGKKPKEEEDIQKRLTLLGQLANRAVDCDVFAVKTTTHPVNDTDVLPEAWPQEASVLAGTEPVDVEDLGHLNK